MLFSPLLHPVLGVRKTPFGMVDTEVISPTMVKTIQLTSLAVSLLATRVLSVALLYSGHCSFFSTSLEHWYLQYQYFLWNRSAATVPMCTTASSWFLSKSFSLQVGVSCVTWLCTVPLPTPLLLVVCPQYHHYSFDRMSTTYCTVVLLYYHYLCCCVASCYKYCFFFLSAAA